MVKYINFFISFINSLFKKNIKKTESDVSPVKMPITFSRIQRSRREPYFIQIGLDFGTSYSKCVYRDIFSGRVWVHIPKRNNRNNKLPFLDPSIVIYKDGVLSNHTNLEQNYPELGLYHIKVALVEMALSKWSDPVLEAYKKLFGTDDKVLLERLIELCAIYYLACVLGEVRSKIRSQFYGFGSDKKDYMAVNMALPVGGAEIPEVNNLFFKILNNAWLIADSFSERPVININELENLLLEKQDNNDPCMNQDCYIYPEVSANVQSFVRSRVSEEGIYLFSDIGAGSVDQSTFIFHRHENQETLAYLCGRVLSLGSSLIEYNTAKELGISDNNFIEELRRMKEIGEYSKEMLQTCKKIEKELYNETIKTLAITKNKLRVKDEINKIRLIFGGGGLCENPYKRGVHSSFSSNIFHEKIYPEIVHIPIPYDIEIDDSSWMHRLSVAYGLSFVKGELARFIYPKEIEGLIPDVVYGTVREIIEAPSKDQC